MRQRNRGVEQSEQNRKEPEIIHIDLDEPENKKEQITIIEEQKVDPNPPKDERPILWLNKLRYYPNDFLQDNMVSFREMMYEDLLKGKIFELRNEENRQQKSKKNLAIPLYDNLWT